MRRRLGSCGFKSRVAEVYNDSVDNTGKLIKTATEVQVSVRDMLRRLGTRLAFADRIATAYAGQGKSGNDLHERLIQQVAALSSAVPTSGPKSSQASMDAAAQVEDQEATLFSMKDTTKPGIDIMGEVTAGELAFMARAVLKGTGERGTLSGSYMFERMLAHFAFVKTMIEVIQGNWTYESNLELFNCLSRVGLTPEESAGGTITADWAARPGYTKVTDVVAEPTTAIPGAYTKVTAKFRK
jgi:hypothetical protein